MAAIIAARGTLSFVVHCASPKPHDTFALGALLDVRFQPSLGQIAFEIFADRFF